MIRTDRGSSTVATVVMTLVGAVVVVGIIVGGYLGGWWLQKDVENRRAKVRRSTYEQQTTYRDEMVRKIADVRAVDRQIEQNPDEAPQLRAQRAAIVDIVCRDNTHIQGGLDSATAAFVGRECA